MNGFLEKKKLSLIAAELLLKESLYASSVHCAFYACVQTLLHVLFVKLKYDRTKFVNDLQQRKTGTHVHAFSLIKDAMIKTRHPDVYWFQNKFKHLKDLRIKQIIKKKLLLFRKVTMR